MTAPALRAPRHSPGGVRKSGPCRCADAGRAEPDLAHDRHRAGAGAGARPIDAEGRRTRRTQSERNRRHCPPMAPGRAGLIHARSTQQQLRATTRSPISSRRLPDARPTNGRGRNLSGPERAAVLMLALGEQHGEKVWKLLDDDELRQLSIAMSTLGTVEAESVESLMLEFVGRLSASGALLGNSDATERLLANTCRPSASPTSWKKSAGRPAATCGRSSPTCRSRCSRTTSRTNTRRPSRW